MRSLKSLVAIAAIVGAIAVSSLPAMAEEILDTMRAAIGNTVHVTEPSRTYDVYYGADHTFRNTLGGNGTWRIAGDTLTLSVNGQDVGSATLPAGKHVGDQFDMHDQTGAAVHVQIVAGSH